MKVASPREKSMIVFGQILSFIGLISIIKFQFFMDASQKIESVAGMWGTSLFITGMYLSAYIVIRNIPSELFSSSMIYKLTQLGARAGLSIGLISMILVHQ